MHIDLSTRRLTSALSLALPLAALAAALLVPAQTAAQTRTLARAHRPACSTSHAASTSHSKTERAVHLCVSSSHKGKGKGDAHHARKGHGKHGPAKKGPHTKTSGSPASAPASCEDGGAPVHAAGGSFACRDGSEPECEDGSTPTPSKGGTGLLCPEAPSEDGSNAGEAQCEEELDSACGPGTEQGSGEHACQASPGGGSEFVCEDER